MRRKNCGTYGTLYIVITVIVGYRIRVEYQLSTVIKFDRHI